MQFLLTFYFMMHKALIYDFKILCTTLWSIYLNKRLKIRIPQCIKPWFKSSVQLTPSYSNQAEKIKPLVTNLRNSHGPLTQRCLAPAVFAWTASYTPRWTTLDQLNKFSGKPFSCEIRFSHLLIQRLVWDSCMCIFKP